MMNLAEPLLKLENVTAGYGNAVVLHGISLELPEHGSLAVLGRNGVGKSTLLLTIMGFTQLRGGKVAWRGGDISRMAPHKRATSGIGWVAQEREIFPSLTIDENLTVAARPGPWNLDAVFRLFPRLAERAASLGANLSGGEQQMLAIGRALMTNPRLLILDEATEGLAPLVRAEIWNCLEGLKAEGLAMIVVDKNIGPLKRLADRHFVVEKGRVVWSGDSDELTAQPELLHRFVGV